MKLLSRFESHLLLIARGIVRGGNIERIWAPLVTALPRPACLSRDAVLLVEETLAKGCVRWLARQGGWRKGKFLRGERPVNGRLWERTPPAELCLKFSAHTLEFLIWLTSIDVRQKNEPLPRVDDQRQLGDRLFFYLACRTCRDTEIFGTLVGQPRIAQDALVSLAYFDLIPPMVPAVAVDFGPWLNEPGSSLLEALQVVMADHLCERENARIGLKPEEMRHRGERQTRIYRNFLKSIDAAGRRDLACFLFDAVTRMLSVRPTSRDWTEAVNVRDLRLADRLEVYGSATTLLSLFLQLHEWDEEARRVGFYDEGYQASQLWKALWEEHHGDELAQRARAILRELEPLAV